MWVLHVCTWVLCAYLYTVFLYICDGCLYCVCSAHKWVLLRFDLLSYEACFVSFVVFSIPNVYPIDHEWVYIFTTCPIPLSVHS